MKGSHQDNDIIYPGDYPVFFIGASAGGVTALQTLVAQLPKDFPAPVFILLHRLKDSPDNRELFAKLIQARANMSAILCEGDEIVKAGHIYMPKNGTHIGVEDNRVILPLEPSDSRWRPSIDVLFKTGAREYTNRCVSILLTGGLNDGVEGLKETTFHGGVTVTQSPQDAHNPELPLNALEKDHPCYVLPLDEMAPLMCELCHFEHYEGQKEIAYRALESARVMKGVVKDAVC